MELFFNLIVVGLVVAGVWLALQPRYVFVVRIENGVPRLKKGKVTPIFVQELSEACKRHRVTCGWVGGIQRGRGLALTFSRSVPPACRQQLRNLWAMHG